MIVITGPAGYGKSSLLAEFPKPLDCVFDQFDQGLMDLVDNGRINPEGIWLPEDEEIISHDSEGWNNLLRLLNSKLTLYRASDEIPRTIGMENLKGFETACFKYECAHEYGNSWDKFMTFSNGPKTAAADEWPRFLDLVNAFRSLGIHVVITGHTAVATKKSAEYDHPVSVPTVTPYIFDATIKDANLVMQIGLDYEVTSKGQGDYQTIRASKDSKTKLICNKSPIYGSCKNHYGIEDEIVITGPPAQTYRDICKAGSRDPKTFLHRKGL